MCAGLGHPTAIMAGTGWQRAGRSHQGCAGARGRASVTTVASTRRTPTEDARHWCSAAARSYPGGRMRFAASCSREGPLSPCGDGKVREERLPVHQRRCSGIAGRGWRPTWRDIRSPGQTVAAREERISGCWRGSDRLGSKAGRSLLMRKSGACGKPGAYWRSATRQARGSRQWPACTSGHQTVMLTGENRQRERVPGGRHDDVECEVCR